MSMTDDGRADIMRWVKASLADSVERRRSRRHGDKDWTTPTASNALFDRLCEEAQDWLTDPNRKPSEPPCPVFTRAVHKWVSTLD